MSRPSSPTRRLAAVATTATLLAAGLLTGTATAGANGSSESVTGLSGGSVNFTNFDPFGSGSTGYDTDLQRSDTATVDNVTITRAVVGPNVTGVGEKVTYRTTFAATGAPDRLITRIDDGGPGYSKETSAKITYTAGDGRRTTEAITSTPGTDSLYVAPGTGWPITAAGATVVLEVTYTWTGTLRQGEGVVTAASGVTADISGLGTQTFYPMNALVTCDPCTAGVGNIGSSGIPGIDFSEFGS
ncbi:hypothetical protein [Rhodococcus sp. UNC363MFTsu5.1]|uniref:hypothetical protein n=1 Tax=Rhodococcus sp. UNC363MFTsu5.1 TaxID=1449069 RepID=UPI0004836D5F|nr:hypothetical protein [Rhodococcus sp. UNC363MFTsu5.1]